MEIEVRTWLNLAAAMAAPQDVASVEMTLAEFILGPPAPAAT